MKFYHQSFDLKKFKMRSIVITKTSIVAMYVLMNIIRDHFDMSTLSLLFDELFVMRSTRRERSSLSSSRNDNEKYNDDDDDDDDENDDNDEKDDDDENDDDDD